MKTDDLAGLARQSAALASDWLESLEPSQRDRALLPFESDDRLDWDYRPGDRVGLAIRDMSQPQRAAAMRLVENAFSERGAAEVRAVMAHESVLGQVERQAGRGNWLRRDPERYWFAVFGDPRTEGPWGWRVDGHHVSVNVTVVGEAVSVTPAFLGANPARVATRPGEELRLLAAEEDLARDLLAALSAAERSVAVFDAIAPDDILTSNLRRFEPDRLPVGIPYGDLRVGPRAAFERLVRHYLTRASAVSATAAWATLDIDALTFAWAGPHEPGHGHYYVVRGGDFLIEYDNTQNGANHIHSVWRDAANDWGDDLLAAHYAAFDHT